MYTFGGDNNDCFASYRDTIILAGSLQESQLLSPIHHLNCLKQVYGWLQQIHIHRHCQINTCRYTAPPQHFLSHYLDDVDDKFCSEWDIEVDVALHGLLTNCCLPYNNFLVVVMVSSLFYL